MADFSAQGNIATGLMSFGARATARSNAAMTSANMSPTQQAAYMQSGIQIGNEAVETIQRRFWQSQWDAFYAQNVTPRIEELKQVQAKYMADTKMAVRPVPTTLNVLETQNLALVGQLANTHLFSTKSVSASSRSSALIQMLRYLTSWPSA